LKVIFRTDSSLEIGTGHVMRCLCLAEALRDIGADVEFICRQHEGHSIEKIIASGFLVHELEPKKNSIVEGDLKHSTWLGVTQDQDADDCVDILQNYKPNWLIVDHYEIGEYWHKKLRSTCNRIMVIDDLGDRRLDCDLLLNQNYGVTKEKYQSLVNSECKMMMGTNYVLLRSEFLKWREYSLQRRRHYQVNTLLVTLGGTDPDNYTGQVLKELAKCNFSQDMKIQVIMGEHAPHIEKVKIQALKMSVETVIRVGVDNMAELMANSDLAIGAAGSTSWERCCLGLPTMQIVIAENQRKIAEALARVNAVKLLKNPGDIVASINSLDDWILQVKNNCQKIVSGSGATMVANYLSLKN